MNVSPKLHCGKERNWSPGIHEHSLRKILCFFGSEVAAQHCKLLVVIPNLGLAKPQKYVGDVCCTSFARDYFLATSLHKDEKK